MNCITHILHPKKPLHKANYSCKSFPPEIYPLDRVHVTYKRTTDRQTNTS